MKRFLFPVRQVSVAPHHPDDIPRSQNDMLTNVVHRQLIADPLSTFVIVIEHAAMKHRHAKIRRRRVEQLEIGEVSAEYKNF